MGIERLCPGCNGRFIIQEDQKHPRRYCSGACAEQHKIKLSNEKWINSDYKKKKDKLAAENRKKSRWGLWGVSKEPYAPGLKRFRIMRG